MLKVVNFSHPLTAEQLGDIEATMGEWPKVIDIKVNIDFDRPLGDQVPRIVDQADINWELDNYVVRLPGLDAATAAVIAEIHGRSGHFPRIVTIKRKDEKFVLWDIVPLQAVRDDARYNSR